MRLKILLTIMVISAGTLVFFVFKSNSESIVFAEKLTGETGSYEKFVNDAAVQKRTDPKLVTVQFFGDIMLDRQVASKMGKLGLSYIFKNLTSTNMLGGADLTVANLEGSFAKYRVSTTKAIAFRFDPKYASQLKQFGFSGFDLANNHSYDMGSRNVAFTRETLLKNGLNWFGDELAEGEKYTWLTTTTNGNRVAFLGVHNTYHEPDPKKLEQALSSARSKADYVIVNVHWGVEYKPISSKKQQELAHWLVDHGADAVIGHHPHVTQEMEIYKSKPIFYSLGNFVFDQYFSTSTQHGFSVGLTLGGGKVMSAYIFPFASVRSQVIPLKGEEADKMLNKLNEISKLGNKKIENGVLTF